MNLPSTAIDFVQDFKGLYAGHTALFEPHTDIKLPLIHCYCFGPKKEEGDNDNMAAKELICEQISEKLGFPVSLESPDTEIFDVRDVAPNKSQFCATFRLPSEVAFREI